MKQASKPSRLRRAAQIGIASVAFAVVAACGGGGDNNNSSSGPAGGVNLQVVSFGTSLSDVGTYSPVILANFGGGRFTTNPGEIWTQKVAEYYGGTLTPAFLGGFGQPLAASTGLGYAQGGALVIGANGIGHAPAGQPPYAQATTVPVATQVQNYLSAHGSFNAGQLVLVEGGANDVLVAAQTAQATIAAAVAQGANPGTATTAAVTAAAGTLVTTAQQMVQQVIAPILAAGATHVVVANVPDIAVTPLGINSGASGQQLFKTLVGAFNQSLQGTLAATGLLSKVIYLQTDKFIDGAVANYQANGFTVSNTGTACRLADMQAAAAQYGVADPSAFASSLFCSPQLLTVAGADQSYMFADTIHPTTHLHALFATQAQQAIAATGLGK
ncbi:SGNH/GDSL hydrolase family protein [Paraburkholderia rhizosphaerae]|uniref:Phospholipase/lecithinase/hemolysin n=1 Tax=Paraburkholderia rhizosphaerae TaxID=480658 RepID=A0A4R8M1W5_9BURK|nr:SGNH/GDSL hydrolase family protein [Paraburkholderia rhizosphaerae]TDY53280.1 phospholipase/lecithinase/hemolysin [Paraburkholderia rhizosphaerae]